MPLKIAEQTHTHTHTNTHKHTHISHTSIRTPEHTHYIYIYIYLHTIPLFWQLTPLWTARWADAQVCRPWATRDTLETEINFHSAERREYIMSNVIDKASYGIVGAMEWEWDNHLRGWSVSVPSHRSRQLLSSPSFLPAKLFLLLISLRVLPLVETVPLEGQSRKSNA